MADSPPVIAAPSMWTRPQIKDFKEKIRQDADSVITVGRGEVVTVRVPTHEEGSYLFWEFATDYYDIGFGVFFEWTDASSASVSVHVSESSDEDEEDEGEAFESINDTYLVQLGQFASMWLQITASGLSGDPGTDCPASAFFLSCY